VKKRISILTTTYFKVFLSDVFDFSNIEAKKGKIISVNEIDKNFFFNKTTFNLRHEENFDINGWKRAMSIYEKIFMGRISVELSGTAW